MLYNIAYVNAINAEDPKRNFENLYINSSKGRGEKIAFETRYKVLSDELETIAKTSRLGWNIKFDYKNKRFVFESLVGIDRTVNQADVPPMIFSRRYDNVLELEYTKDVSEYKNCAIVAGQGEGANREIVIVNDNLSGQDRKELFVDARDIEDGPNLADRGKSKLAENTIIESFEATIDTESYRVEWDLGDFVTILDDEIGVISDIQIVEIREIYEEGILTIEPTFGE
ncbi:MAG: siphovirus ReqiPepy6 Gp37-like family protein, partial [Clostridium celatum]|nr:siphovirus ReqiPepy6 Gp37-like family protein [Clostridium celatum]